MRKIIFAFLALPFLLFSCQQASDYYELESIDLPTLPIDPPFPPSILEVNPNQVAEGSQLRFRLHVVDDVNLFSWEVRYKSGSSFVKVGEVEAGNDIGVCFLKEGEHVVAATTRSGLTYTATVYVVNHFLTYLQAADGPVIVPDYNVSPPVDPEPPVTWPTVDPTVIVVNPTQAGPGSMLRFACQYLGAHGDQFTWNVYHKPLGTKNYVKLTGSKQADQIVGVVFPQEGEYRVSATSQLTGWGYTSEEINIRNTYQLYFQIADVEWNPFGDTIIFPEFREPIIP